MAFTFPAMVAEDPATNAVVKNVSFQVYAVTDTAFLTPLPITDTFNNPLAGGILNSGTKGVFPQFQQATNSTVVIADATKVYAWTINCVQQDSATASFINTPGSATATALSATYASKATTIPKWVTATAYTAGQQVISPAGDIVSAIASHTSGATFNPANWSYVRISDYFINIKSYGAKGDGTTDDSAALAAAINVARTAYGTGPTNAINMVHIFVPVGNYNIVTAPPTIDFPGLIIQGAGRSTTRFIWNGTGPLFSMGTYTTSGGYGGAGTDFDLSDIELQASSYLNLSNEGTRLGVGIQDNGAGGARLRNVWIRGFKYGYYGAYGSDFDRFMDCDISNNDVGMYFGPGSQQISIDRSYFSYNAEGIVIEGAPQGSINNCWFVLNSVSDVTVEGNTTTRSGVSGMATGAGYDMQWSTNDCWHETNAGGLGRIAPRIYWFHGAPPQNIKHFRINRPVFFSGGATGGTDAFIEVNVTGSFVADSLRLTDFNVSGSHIASVVKNTSGLGTMLVDVATAADGYTLPPIYSTKAAGLVYNDKRGNYFQGSNGSAAVEVRDNTGSGDTRTKFVQNADTSLSVQFWSGSAYIERLRLDTQNSRIYLGNALDTYLQRSAAGVVATPAAGALKTGLNVTGSRPSATTMGQGAQFFDTTLNKPIWSDGTNWGTFEAQNALVFNVKNYGAKGDGTTDDSAAINAAIAGAGSGCVYFPAGTYMANNLTVSSTKASLLGYGRGTVIKKNANGALLTISGTQNRVSGITLDGNGGTYTGVCVEVSADDCTIHDAYALNSGVNAHTIHASKNRLSVVASRIDGNVYVENGDAALVDGCKFFAPAYASTTDYYGVVIAALTSSTNHADGARIVNNYFEISTYVFAICPLSRNGAIPPRGVNISNNTIVATTNCYGGISVDTCGDATVSGNSFRVSAGTPATGALEIVKSSNVTATGNDFDGGTVMSTLVSVNNSSECTLTGNTLRIANTTGTPNIIAVQNPAAGNVTHRNIITANKFVISAGGARAVYIFTNNTGCAADANIVAGNSIYGNSSSRGIGLDAVTGTITNTTISNNTVHTASQAFTINNDSGTQLMGNRVVSVTTNVTVLGTGGAGIQVEGNSWQSASAAPTTQYHFAGERVLNNAPTVGSPSGWVCTVAGTPGTWVYSSTIGGNPNQLTTGEAVLDRFAGGHDNTSAIGSGFMLATYFTAQKTESITQVRAATGNTAYGATPTLCRYGIYSVASDGSLTLVASTANDTTMFAAANTIYTRTLTSTFNKVAGVRYAVAVLVVTAAAAGTFQGYSALSNATSNFDLGPQLSAAVSGQSDLPSSLSGAQPVTTRVPQFLLLP